MPNLFRHDNNAAFKPNYLFENGMISHFRKEQEA